MAFVVEDGTGLPNSNMYLSLEEFKDYHDTRGGDYSSATDEQIQQAIVRATDYIDTRFSFLGIRRLQTQALEWPRYDVYYRDGRTPALIPVEIKEATAEYALRALTAVLAPDPEYDDTGRVVTGKREKVGPIEEETKYSDQGLIYTFRKYPMADKRLKELVTNGKYLSRV